ncbi:helix-turn-helix transcriptional regulator [Treponema brennaborense]|uniref:Helix-turn-helix type 11 domain-containing protein n=1 Tax=Treponema brennaborense (strain DSM 12168 / CIP 105900 / DD5/3) TaxID=906968 RepID=F4LII8_TREBD|nr:YafY family protein [Treponema brennaborense]AEE17213.1 helix-turn-helix type 11 domain-containing protein [Treponema brennaborense DSM 12168]
MKIDRLIGILSVLLQQDKVTAPYLADKFEVSRRTIQRDIEDICRSGIPLVTLQGQNGGISIMDGFRLDRTLLTSSDMQAILAGIRSLDSVSGSARYRQLMEKLSAGNSDVLASNNHISIDLSSWYKSSIAPKIELIQAAVGNCEHISFTYFSPKGETFRRLEPYRLLFRWSSWYAWGWCLERGDFRMFKLNRMQQLTPCGSFFKPRPLPPPAADAAEDRYTERRLDVCAVFEPCMKWRLIDEYGAASFTERDDGKLLFRFRFTDKQWLFGWLLSFGAAVELIEPAECRCELAGIVRTLAAKYG